MTAIDGIILASGYSKRMGRDKLLLPLGNELVIEKVIRAAMQSQLSETILVYRNVNVAQVGRKYGLKTIKNNKARLGQSESVKLGVSASRGDGYLFIAGDQPFLSSTMIDEMIQAFKSSGKGMVVPILEGNIHMPILFSSSYRKKLLEAVGEQGGFEIIEQNKDDIYWYRVRDPLDVSDINTERQYKELVARKEVL